jgi:two-component system chemotaxis response regulator CheB
MNDRDIVVMGGSAGGAPAISAILRALPAGFPAAVFVVLHRSGSGRVPLHSSVGAPQKQTDAFVRMFSRESALPVQSAEDQAEFRGGVVYVAPPDHHLYLENGITRLEKSPKENFFRPSIDVLFRSAAAVYGRRCIGVLVSGMLRDGAAGLWQIKKRGGLCIVQDPQEAEYAELPQSALDSDAAHFVLSIEGIAAKLIELTKVDSHQRDAGAAAKILIVEDERIVAKHLQDSLSDMGYRVTGCVTSGESAIKHAKTNRPDLVLMDIRLKGPLTGIEAARRIWEQFQIPVVYLTAHAELPTLQQAQTTQYYGYLVKPIHALGRRMTETR